MDDQYKKFLSSISEVELLSRQVKSSTEKEYRSMVEAHQSLIRNKLEQHSSSLHNMAFRSLTNGELIFYDHKDLDFDQRVKDLIHRRNKHYLWLLAEAFEHFENLIELMYAHIGHREPSAWPSKETKGETPAALAAKPFEWFLKKSELNKKLSVKLECIRKRFPSLTATEKSNYFDIDFRFTICLIEMLRHIIVHNSGKIIDYQKFVARTFEQAGMSNNGNHDPQKLQLINNFVATDGGAHRIVMLEVQDQGTPFHKSRISSMINWLLAYADHIYRVLIQPAYFALGKN